jgi:hypothetical protein
VGETDVELSEGVAGSSAGREVAVDGENFQIRALMSRMKI